MTSKDISNMAQGRSGMPNSAAGGNPVSPNSPPVMASVRTTTRGSMSVANMVISAKYQPRTRKPGSMMTRPATIPMIVPPAQAAAKLQPRLTPRMPAP